MAWLLDESRGMSEADYAAAGYPAKVAAYMAAHPTPPPVIWADLWPAIELFLAMDTQWDRDMNGAAGLKLDRLEYVAGKIGVEVTTDCFEDVRALERETLRTLGERRARPAA